MSRAHPLVDFDDVAAADPHTGQRFEKRDIRMLAYRKNERARSYLERRKDDPDPFVRKKVEEALEGKTKADF